MEQRTRKNKNLIIATIIALIIIVVVVVVVVLGFNKELRYEKTQKIDVYVENEVDYSKIKEIVNDVLNERNIIETVEVYQDLVTIRAKEINEEQKNNIVNKLKENYEFKQTAEDTTIETIAETRIIDMYKKYIVPFTISGVLVLAYMIIRYRKNGTLKVLTETVLIPVVGELLLLSIIAITRIPLGRFTPILAIMVYIGTVMIVINKNEK